MKKQAENDKKKIGFIAQEVEALFPELVKENDGYLGLTYSGFGVLAIQAIKEQQAVIDSQEERINALEARLSALESR